MATPPMDHVDAYRCGLLTISDELNKGEIKRLLFITSNIPKARREKIEEGFEYFSELEELGLLGPGEYAYLAEKLVRIKRHDLAKKLQSQVPHTPACFSGPQVTHQEVLHSKRQRYTTAMTKISMHRLNDSCMKVTAAWLKSFRLAWQLKVPTEACNVATVCDTLKSISSFLQAYRAHKPVVLSSRKGKQLSEELKPWSMQCSTSAESFKAQRGTYPIDHLTEDELKIPVHEAYESILDICTTYKVSGIDAIKEEVEKVRGRLSVIEACAYSTSHWLPMFEWMGNLINSATPSDHTSLALSPSSGNEASARASPQLDLSQCKSQLMKIISIHGDAIMQSHGILLRIVGAEVMEKIAPALKIPIPETTTETKTETEMAVPYLRPIHSSNTGPYDHVQTLSTPWYTFLLLLIGLAFNCRINPAEVCQRLNEYSFNDATFTNQHQSCTTSLRNMVGTMHEEVHDLKRKAVKIYSVSSPGIKELLSVP